MKGIIIKSAGVFLSLLLLCSSCRTVNDDIVPYAKVSFNISLNIGNLVHVGGCESYSGGVRGVVVYRLDMTTFYAYDRACPHDWKSGGRVVYNTNTMMLKCEECGSCFSILNGYPMSDTITVATTPLRAYQARMIDDYTLHISN
jgi:nitrite reductase/ring-hydroxylating ferredoxin subunit